MDLRRKIIIKHDWISKDEEVTYSHLGQGAIGRVTI